jgi:HK97 family phage major capsid protein
MDEKKIKELYEQVKALTARSQELYDESVVLLNADDIKGSKEKEEEADKIKAKAVSLRQLAEKQQENLKAQKALAEPVLPAPLPGAGHNGGTIVQPQSPVSADPQPEEAVKAIYQMRYGAQDAGVKAIIFNLYGSSYEEDRMNQRKAFLNYMTNRDHLIDANGWDLLRRAIPTPNFVKKAIDAGWDANRIKATMVEAVDTTGGYTVPVDFQEDIISRLPGFSVMRGRAGVRQTTRDRVQFVKRSGGGDQYIGNVRMVWAEETPASASTTETNATYSLEDIPVHTLMGVVPISKNLIEDSPFNLESDLTMELTMARAIAEDNAFLVGDGVGKPQGVLKGGTSLPTGLASVSSGAAAALTFNGLIAMTFGIASQYKQGNRQGPNGLETRAVWIAEKATYQAIAELTDADGAYLWTEMRGDNARGNPTTLRGYTWLEQEIMPTVGAGTYPILFGNPEAFEIVDRVGMTVQRYDTSPGQNIVHYEAKFRVGGQVVRPWMMCAQLVSA